MAAFSSVRYAAYSSGFVSRLYAVVGGLVVELSYHGADRIVVEQVGVHVQVVFQQVEFALRDEFLYDVVGHFAQVPCGGRACLSVPEHEVAAFARAVGVAVLVVNGNGAVPLKAEYSGIG